MVNRIKLGHDLSLSLVCLLIEKAQALAQALVVPFFTLPTPRLLLSAPMLVEL